MLVVRKLLFGLILLASSATAQVFKFDSSIIRDWYNAPGEWVVPYVVEPSPFALEPCPNGALCTSFMATYKAHVPTCLRWLDPKVIRDGREIPGHVTETGTPGEPDWEWTFQTDELFTGPFIWKVKTIDMCPKVG